MFTGIVEEAGVVETIKPTQKSIEFSVRAKGIARGLKVGASVAVNGCCLTVVKISARGKASYCGSMCCKNHGREPITSSPSPG